MGGITDKLYDRIYCCMFDDRLDPPSWVVRIEREGKPIYMREFYGDDAEQQAKVWKDEKINELGERWAA